MIQQCTPRNEFVTSPLASYLRQIDETALLTAAEEKQLAYRIQDGDGPARDRMVRANLRLVVSIARRFIGKGLSLQDLIEEGNLGLLRAVEAFDPSRDIRFSTYASYWIKQSIKRGLQNMGKTIRLPAYMVQLLSQWRRAVVHLNDIYGRPPTDEEVVRYLRLPRKKLAVLRKALRLCQGEPQTGCDEMACLLEERLPDSRTPAPDAEIVRGDERRRVLELLEELDQREAQVLRMRFGLDGEDTQTLKAVGLRLGLTRERVRQIETGALRKLRDGLVAI